MNCANCGKNITRVYWLRQFPSIVFCGTCWKKPQTAATTIRKSIAAALRLARSRNKLIAKDVLKSLRGTGVPPNPRRGHGKT